MLRGALLRAARAAAQRLPAALAATPACTPCCCQGTRLLTVSSASGAPAALTREVHRLAFFPASVRALHGTGAALQVPAEDTEHKGEPSEAEPQVRHDAGDEGKSKTYEEGYIAPHPGSANTSGEAEVDDAGSYMLMHPVYTPEYVLSIHPRHKKPGSAMEWTGYWTVTAMRWSFDVLTGYRKDRFMSSSRWLTRILFLETVAGVPGMVGGMLRHMRSLRTMKRDRGWIHTLLEEAENERMHLLTFLTLKEKNNLLFRTLVIGGQGVFFLLYMLFYSISARHCHAFVGYLEEEAVKTYTHLLHQIDSGELEEWVRKPAPGIARNYWKMPPDATMRDVVLAVRADEACHSHVNHTFSALETHAKNPFSGKGSELVA